MRTGKILWGLILLAIGVLLLLDNLGIVTFSWYSIIMWWPLLLIYWGIAAFTRTPESRLAGFLIFLIIAAGLITASVRYNWMRTTQFVGVEQQLSEAWRTGTATASFTLQSGAGEFAIEGISDQLVSATAETPFGQYALVTSYADTAATTTLSLTDQRPWRGMMVQRARHRVVVHLNPNPIWNITVESGAASINLDLTEIKVKELVVKSGASSVVAALGDSVDHATVVVKTGASSVDLTIPSNVGGKITADSGLSSHEFAGFEKQTDGVYQTPDYNTAQKTVDITLSAGVSSLSVTRR